MSTLIGQQGGARQERATLIKSADVYVSPDAQAERVSLVTPGHEVLITDRSGPWVKVFANTDVQERRETEDEPEFSTDPAAIPRAGWIRDKGIVSPSTPAGDRILFGAAASAEAQAAEPHAPKLAVGSAHLLYRRMAEYFPQSPLAAEAQWRSADIRWQEDKFDASSLPSWRDSDPNARPKLYDKALRDVVKRYPNTKWAQLAAWDLLDAKLCGDWQGLPKCPALESDVYERYARDFAQSPKCAEALWNAAYRQAVLVTMYTADDQKKRADGAARKAHAINDQLQHDFPASDYAARSLALIFRMDAGIANYGTDRD